jgi:hypothetical protein
VENERDGREPKTQSEFRRKLKIAVRVMRMFLGGIGFALLSGSGLLALRNPHSHWGIILELSPLILAVPDLFSEDERPGSGCLMGLALLGFLAGLFFMRAHYWAPVAVGALLATFFWARSKSTKRSYLFLSAGSLLAGLLSLEVSWPNEQRCLLTLMGVGVTMSLQGAWIIVRYLQGHRPAELTEPAASSKESLDKRTLSFLRLIFGTIGHVQIFSPDIEQRIRTRYQSEIDQLKDLGFDYHFSDGETFTLIRLVLLLPALVVFAMWCKREVMTIHDGTKHLVGHPVYISKNKTAFAEPSGLGTKFYTTFQDGSLLISTTYADGGMPAGPMIERHGQKASISETWASHQQRIAELETEGKRVDRQTGYQAYAEIEHKETAPW